MSEGLINPQVRARFEKYFFEEICGLETGDRKDFSIQLHKMKEEMYFSCVQDTVARLQSDDSRLSVFQWRNCIFVPVSQNANLANLHLLTFQTIQSEYPSLFIRSYVYVIYIKVPDSQTLAFDSSEEIIPKKDDFQIYLWNTKYDIVRTGKNDLFSLKKKNQNDTIKGKSTNSIQPEEKVFIVSNPESELNRIEDANSDVIDTVKAFMRKLTLYGQTEKKLNEIESAIDTGSSNRILVQGPARSGKTILAMTVLANHEASMMLLMNWYFFDALKDAFKIWATMSEDKIASMFTTSESVLEAIDELTSIRKFAKNPDLLDTEIFMRSCDKQKLSLYPRWITCEEEKSGYRITQIEKRKENDFAFVLNKKKNEIKQSEGNSLNSSIKNNEVRFVMRMVKITGVQREDKTASVDFVYPLKVEKFHSRIISNDLTDQNSNHSALEKLIEYRDALEENTIDKLIAKKLKQIGRALEKSGQKFFHHDYSQDGFIEPEHLHLLANMQNSILIVDEAQRIGPVKGDNFDKSIELAKFPGNLLLFGDDNQMLNSKIDKGIKTINRLSINKFQEINLPESIGIPNDITKLILKLLGEEEEINEIQTSFEIKLIHDDDSKLVHAFESDTSHKKHYAMPAGASYELEDSVPGIIKQSSGTQECTSKCTKYCSHRFIPMLSPRSDSKWGDIIPNRKKDLSRNYKYFCSEQIMPNYVLSAYELISREVESLYLKIPSYANAAILNTSINIDKEEAWVKRHLYVLMTRATGRLVINIQDKELYNYFEKVCKDAGLNPSLSE